MPDISRRAAVAMMSGSLDSGLTGRSGTPTFAHWPAGGCWSAFAYLPSRLALAVLVHRPQERRKQTSDVTLSYSDDPACSSVPAPFAPVLPATAHTSHRKLVQTVAGLCAQTSPKP